MILHVCVCQWKNSKKNCLLVSVQNLFPTVQFMCIGVYSISRWMIVLSVSKNWPKICLIDGFIGQQSTLQLVVIDTNHNILADNGTFLERDRPMCAMSICRFMSSSVQTAPNIWNAFHFGMKYSIRAQRTLNLNGTEGFLTDFNRKTERRLSIFILTPAELLFSCWVNEFFVDESWMWGKISETYECSE